MAKTKKTAVSTEVKTAGESINGALYLKRPRLTEKSGLQAEKNNVYTFEVRANATKTGIKKAITEMYKVIPTKVNITKLPAKSIFARGRKGVQSGVKKAVVYLKEGDKIEFI